mgnify:CR=1 FL=1
MIEIEGEGDFEIIVDDVLAVEVSTGLFILVADQGKILVIVIITTVIKVVILAEMV